MKYQILFKRTGVLYRGLGAGSNLLADTRWSEKEAELGPFYKTVQNDVF